MRAAVHGRVVRAGGSPAKWGPETAFGRARFARATHFAGEPPARTTLAGPDGDPGRAGREHFP